MNRFVISQAFTSDLSRILVRGLGRMHNSRGHVHRSSHGNPFIRLQTQPNKKTVHMLSIFDRSGGLRPRQSKFTRCLSIIGAGSGRIDIAAVKPKSKPYRLVLVESPSKCKTISKILNGYVKDNDLDYEYVVAATMGHIRNLPKSASGVNQTIAGVDVHNRYTPTYEILPGKDGLVRDLKTLAKDAQEIVLATDEDREGEAIAWHVSEVLGDQVPQVRVTFTEITPKAILHSIHNPRDIDMNLVQAQETRRILDRLAGYTLSPLLWKKIAPGLSAGRVQSVGMSLVVHRERERLLHVPVEYWDMQATFDDEVTASLVQVNGEQIARGSDFNNTGALISENKLHVNESLVDRLLVSMANGEVNLWLQDHNVSKWTVKSVKSTERTQKPPMPFITSTLQQEGVRKLGLSVSQTMSCAQKLYEAGIISYMRTDSTFMSEDAQNATANAVISSFGSSLLAPSRESKKSKNAQESHEAIRPAIQPDGHLTKPHELVDKLSDAELKLYELIYMRTLASRMKPQVLNSTSMDIEGVSVDGETTLLFRVSGSVVVLPGYTLVYDKPSVADQVLPPWKEGQDLVCQNLSPVQHSTKPPPRYTEASFVKDLEALGIGRPSTYAGIVQILRERAYVGTPVSADGTNSGKDVKRSGTAIPAARAAGGSDFTGGGRGPMVPSLPAFVVCSLLEKHLSLYVDPTFTARMEDQLDAIARGDSGSDRTAYLDGFYGGDNGLAATVKRVDTSIDSDEARRVDLPGLLSNPDGHSAVSLMIGPWGPYIQKLDAKSNERAVTAQLPAGMAADLSTITSQALATLLESREKDGVLLGNHPDDGREIRLKVGRYGAYLQWGKGGENNTTNHSLPRHIGNMRNMDTSLLNDSKGRSMTLDAMIGLSFDDAVQFVSLPRTVSMFNNLPIIASIGPYGPYLKYNNTFASLRKTDSDVLKIEEHEAKTIVTQRIIQTKSGGRDVIAELGEKEGSPVRVKNGRFGLYVNWNKVNAKLPNAYHDNPDQLSLDEGWTLIEEKRTNSPNPSSKGKKGPMCGLDTPGIDLPSPPKRPRSAYLLFCEEKRPAVSETLNTLGEISKELARLWALTADDHESRTPYLEKAVKEKEEFRKKLIEWEKECEFLVKNHKGSNGKPSNGIRKSSTSSMGKGSKSKISSFIDLSRPKKPLSSYLHFCAANRAEVSQRVKSLGNVSKELARLWAETEGSPERTVYEEMAAADKVRYQTESATSIPRYPGDAVSNISVNGKSPKVNGKSPKVYGEAEQKKKRARSAYMIFCSEYRGTITDEDGQKLPFGETTKKLAEMWRACDAATKLKFEAEAKKEKAIP